MAKSKIEWTESTWNPTTGCTKTSPGCKNCYAEKMSLRLQTMGVYKYRNGFELTVHEDCLIEPNTWKKPRMVFVNSMSDLFHELMPLDFIKAVFKVINENPQHIFQILTKRAEILNKYSCLLDWSDNLWMGVSIEDSNQLWRLDYLKSSNAYLKFLSLEPLLSKIPFIDLSGIDWVIVGGESGPNSRKIEKDWIISIRDNCLAYDVPFFFKQWGGTNKKKSGRLLEGQLYNAVPKHKLKRELSF